jgi:hypothetical protein
MIPAINPYEAMMWIEGSPLLDFGVSKDALFIAYCAAQAKEPKRPPEIPVVVPDQFHIVVAENAGKALSASDVFRLAFGAQPTMLDCRKSAYWLRHLGKSCRRSGGKQIFDL